MRKKEKLNNLKVTLYSILVVAISFILLVSIDLLFKTINPNNHDKKDIVNYNAEDKITYNVEMTENDFYESKNDNNNKYISSLVDYFDFNVLFNYESSKLLDYKYNYSVNASIVALSDGEVIYSKDVKLIPEITNEVDKENYININPRFKVKFREYNEFMKNYKDTVNMDITSYIKVVFKSTITSSDIEDFKYHDVIEIKIPLLNDLTSVTFDQTGFKNGEAYLISTVTEKSSTPFKLLYLFGCLVSVIIDGILLYHLAKLTNRDRFYREMNAVFKVYADILVEVEEVPIHKQLGEIVITNFVDLVDVSNKLCLPILYKKTNNEFIFFIMTDKYFYKYMISKRIFNRENK